MAGMNARNLFRLLVALLGGAAGAFGARTHVAYRSELGAARALAHSSSQVIQTACGPIEYAQVGEGVPVLVLHGILGGFDQSLLLAEGLVSDGFRVIAPSRFGYLRSPLPADPSSAAQADAYACLLDELRIRRVAVVGISAGASSALQFARRHSGHCLALVLISTAIHAPMVPAGLHATLAKAILGSEFWFWWLITHGRRGVPALIGVPPSGPPTQTIEDRAALVTLRQRFLPVRPRRRGILNDLALLSSADDRAESGAHIATPTLILHAADDPLAPFAQAKALAAGIPGARFISIDGGGHFMLGHQGQAKLEIARFFHEHAAVPAV
jgi:2-hydroxy-6-oxonona-2,4-dienedioate hydrolase